MPSLIDAGINGLWISKIRGAAMQYRALGERYGPDVALIGGIEASAHCREESAVRPAVRETVPELLKSGRYLPCLDDRPRENVPFAHYRLYRRLLEEMAQKG